MKLLIRLFLATISAIALASCGLKGNNAILQSLFTVLGIAFSISVSILISFDLSKVYNKKIRNAIRERSRNILLAIMLDFIIAAIASVCGLIMDDKNIPLPYHLQLNMSLTASMIVLFSLIYELYNFRQMQKLKDDLTDRIMDEEINKKV
jgi:cation transport ATPase